MNKFFSTSIKALAIVALLSNATGFAMEAAPVAPAVSTVVTPAPVVVVETKKDCASCHKFTTSIKNGWNKAVSAAAAQKNQIFAAAKDMKARGWTNWTRNEKAGVVIGAAAVAAVTAVVVYKAYKALTTPKVKATVTVRTNRA